MPSRRRQGVVQGRWDDHLDDGLAAPAERARVAIGAVHVAKARCKNDSRGVMIAERVPRQGREAGQFRERDVHAERTGAAAPGAHAAQKGWIKRALWSHPGIEELG